MTALLAGGGGEGYFRSLPMSLGDNRYGMHIERESKHALCTAQSIACTISFYMGLTSVAGQKLAF